MIEGDIRNGHRCGRENGLGQGKTDENFSDEDKANRSGV